jgi:hypothetical protein
LYCTSQLYNRRDDVDDDAADDDHISEHLKVSEFCDSIQLVLEQNFSYAAYVFLASSGVVDEIDCNGTECVSDGTKVLGFGVEDVNEVMKTLDFVKVGQVTISLDTPTDHGETFLKMFDSILYPFPRSNYCFYLNNDVLDYEFSLKADKNLKLLSKNSNLGDADDEQQSISSNKPDRRDTQIISDIGDAMSEIDATQVCMTSAPKFVRFLINDAPLSTGNENKITNDSTLSVLISIFKNETTQKTKI